MGGTGPRRWVVWIAARGAADVAGVGGAIGAAVGALLGGLWADGHGRLNAVATWGGAGAAFNGGVALAVWAVARVRIRFNDSTVDGVTEQLFARFRTASIAQVRRQWRLMLDGRERIEATFTGYRRIASPRAFAGSIRHRSDLAAAVDAAAADDGGPRLLIVGPPGYGKTVALLDAAQHLADRQGGRFGAPVIFNLGSWAHEDHDLSEWMVRELCATTGLLPGADRIVRQWTTEGRIAPVLDGLDEITEPENRQRCVLAINAFLDESPDQRALLVASRPDEYTEITSQGANRLAVNAAIALGPFTSKQVASRLKEVDTASSRSLAELVETAPGHPAAEVLRVPLWLWMAGTLTMDGTKRFIAANSVDDAEMALTDAYLTHTITLLSDRVRQDATACRSVLAAIAGFLRHQSSPDSTTFRLENLTPPHPTLAQIRAVNIAVLVGMSLLFGLIIGLVLGPGAGVVFGLFQTVAAITTGYRRLGQDWANALPARSRIRWRGIIRLFGELPGSLLRALRRGPLLGWIFARLARWIGVGLLGGLIYGLVRGPTEGMVIGLTAALIGFLSSQVTLTGSLMFFALVDVTVVPGDTVDDGRKVSRASVVLVATAIGVAGGLLAALVGSLVGKPLLGLVGGLAVGLLVGLVTSRNYGGWYLRMQQQVRRRATERGLMPPDPAAFLIAAADVGILRRTGGGVQFRHRMLADRLAEEAPTPGLMDLRRLVGTEQRLTAPPSAAQAAATA